MDADFGVLAMWIYSTRYSRFKEANPWDGLVKDFGKLPKGHILPDVTLSRGTREREALKEMGDHVLSSRDIKHLLSRAWSLYGIPVYLSGELDTDIFHDPVRLDGITSSLDYVIDLLSSVKLPDVHTVEYDSGWREVHKSIVDVTEDSITTKMSPWGWVRSSSSGFEYKITKPRPYLQKHYLHGVEEDQQFLGHGRTDLVNLIKTHLFISAWIGNLQGIYKVEALDVLAQLLDFMKDESRTWICENHQWEKK